MPMSPTQIQTEPPPRHTRRAFQIPVSWNRANWEPATGRQGISGFAILPESQGKDFALLCSKELLRRAYPTERCFKKQ
jgi:hypothetical protein